MILDNKKSKWYVGDLHTHTRESDGGHSIDEAVQIATNKGLDFIALTDHNTFSQNHKKPSPGDLALISGVELTTPLGHVNFLGVDECFSNFHYETKEDLIDMFQEGRNKGAYISINHPMIGDKWQWGFDGLDFQAVELWNGSPLSRNETIIKWWQTQLSHGQKIAITGGSDVHVEGQNNRWYGEGCTWIKADKLESSSLVESLKKGHHGVAASPFASKVEFWIDNDQQEVMMGDTLKLEADFQGTLRMILHGEAKKPSVLKVFDDTGIVIEKFLGQDRGSDWTLSPLVHIFEVSSKAAFYRVEVWQIDEDILCNPFFTNPIYIER